MTKHLSLLAMLIATKATVAAAQPSTAQATTAPPTFQTTTAPSPPSQPPAGVAPVNLSAVQFLTVRMYPRDAAECGGPPAKVEFWPVGVCMPVPQRPNEPQMYSMAMLGEVRSNHSMAGGGGDNHPMAGDGGDPNADHSVPAYKTALYMDPRCTPLRKVEGSEGVAATAECGLYCDADGRSNCERRQATLDDTIGTGYMELFNTTDCSDTGGPIGSRYMPVDVCLPIDRDPHGVKSMLHWVYPGRLQAHHFMQEACHGEPLPNPDDAMPLGGECTMFPEQDPESGAISYKLWAYKRFGQRSAPRCAWIPRRLAEEINAIPHPNPDSGECMAGAHGGTEIGDGMHIVDGSDGSDHGNMTGGHYHDGNHDGPV